MCLQVTGEVCRNRVSSWREASADRSSLRLGLPVKVIELSWPKCQLSTALYAGLGSMTRIANSRLHVVQAATVCAWKVSWRADVSLVLKFA